MGSPTPVLTMGPVQGPERNREPLRVKVIGRREMITEKSPESWQLLQEWTVQILRECGWTAETEVKVKTVRGSAEIDVFAIETVQGREYKTLVECKNWTARVPQNVVHGFRTVMGDVGANTGYVISKAGFQAGAYEAAANTNVRLLSWTEFQEVFVEQWYWTYLTQQTYEVLDPLCSYLEPLPAMAAWDSYLMKAKSPASRKCTINTFRWAR
jgi:restriction system protein